MSAPPPAGTPPHRAGPPEGTPPHRAGVVALLGRPNAGKSTLLNRLLGEKLAIVTAKPQTTRSRLLGILHRPDAQLLLIDTPGFLAGERPLESAMRAVAEEAARDCDVALLLVDAVRGWEPLHAEWLASLVARQTPVLLLATRCDRPGAERLPWPPPGAEAVTAAIRTSARTGEGLEDLVPRIVALLPESPAFYPDEELTDRPLRFLAAEAVREAAFEGLGQELPYRIAVEVTDFDESDPRLARIRATILVERDSQKKIVIGAGGERIKAIGIRARREIERLLDRQVHLALWVKVEPGWARKPKRLKSLGYC